MIKNRDMEEFPCGESLKIRDEPVAQRASSIRLKDLAVKTLRARVVLLLAQLSLFAI